ncbi:YggT family protein [Alteromonadaceae bacterium Bs31]|nr:YggT family protein [Alteromonadaceae bacterium Bs31]
MNPWVSILVMIIETLATVYLLFVILRFMLQLARADFYNQFSQAIVKITNPLLLPLRKVIPGFWGIDLACLVLALLFHTLIAEVMAVLSFASFINPGLVLLWALLGTIKVATWLCMGCLLVIVVTSFVAPFSSHPALLLIRQLMEPILRPVQKIIPPVGGLDFSVLFVFLGINVLQRVLDIFAANLSLVPVIIIGY